jgi:hypothetical protein
MSLEGVTKIASEWLLLVQQFSRRTSSTVTSRRDMLNGYFHCSSVFMSRSGIKGYCVILDSSPDSPALRQLESDVGNGDITGNAEFDNYLNFFEFVAVLEATKQVTQDEVCDLFDYYLQNLKQRPFVVKYIKAQGFERLSRLLDRLKPPGR